MQKFFSQILLLLCSLLIVNSTLAVDINNNSVETLYINDEIVNLNTEYNGDIFIMGKELNINQNINGSIFFYGDTLNIKSNVNGNIFTFAKNINISESSIINGNIRSIESALKIDGQISKSVYLIGKGIHLSRTGKIDGNVNAIADLLTIEGIVGNDIRFKGASTSTSVNLTGIVNGDLSYSANTKPNFERENIKGDINITSNLIDNKIQTLDILITYVSSLIAYLLIGYIIIKKFKAKRIINELNNFDKNKLKFLSNIWIYPLIILLILVFIIISPTVAILQIGILMIINAVSIPISIMYITYKIKKSLDYTYYLYISLIATLFVTFNSLAYLALLLLGSIILSSSLLVNLINKNET